MLAIRGRIGQFQVLEGEQALLAYVVPTIRLTETSFFMMLERYGHLVLKPVVGMHFIEVCKREDGCTITFQNKRLEIRHPALAYEKITEIKARQNYVIQPIVHGWRRPFHQFVTLQRRAGEWEITHVTKTTDCVTSWLLWKLYRLKIESITRLAAETLHAEYPKTEAIVLDMSVNLFGDVYIHDSALHFSVSKWSQYQMMRQLMPKTELFTERAFTSFLASFDTIFFKPCNGQQGRGIVKLTRNGKSYVLHSGRKKEQIRQTELLKKLKWNESMLIQQGIPLAQVNGAVFDIRVLVKKRDGHWYVHRKAVKVAGDGYIITNAAQAVLSLEEVLPQSTIHNKNAEVLNQALDALCLQAARMLDGVHKRTIIGFDVAITNEGQIWILEGNYMPDLAMFHLLKPNANV